MKRFAFFAAMLAIAASCTENEIDNGSEENNKPSLGDTKVVKAPDITATLEGEGADTFWWTPADEINVFYDKSSTHYTSQNSQNAVSAVFSSEDEISKEDLDRKNIWGLHPYDADAVCDGSSVTTTIPASQKAVAGAFDEDLFTSLAHSTGTEMKFYNVLGGIKFSLSRDDVRSITFKGNNNEDIAGKVTLSMDSDGIPVASVTEGGKTITLTPKEGTCFASDEFFYIAMLPVELSDGFTMYLETEADVLVFESSASTQIKRSTFMSAGDIDKHAAYMTPFTITGDIYRVSIQKQGNPDDISLEYRLDDGEWTPYNIGDEFNEGDKLQFRAGEGGNKHFSKDDDNYYYLKCNYSDMNVSGNVMSLLDGTMQDNTLYDYAFYQLFNKETRIIDASKLELPATVLAPNCYDSMFSMCMVLTSAPELPATTLAEECYKNMFSMCRDLKSAPELPATTLADNCYERMFFNCESLESAPELPATTLAEHCYDAMFFNCESLETAPVLPATTLAKNCYMLMFCGCSSLTSAPELPVTVLAEGCYSSMFYDCDYLESAPALPATTLTNSCYSNMFNGCIRLTDAPSLPAETLAVSCYSGMFSGCTELKSAPELPVTQLEKRCYENMFRGCTGLTEAPYLPAETLADYCYSGMFYGCTALTVVKVEFTDWKASEESSYPATSDWLKNVSSTGVLYCPSTLDTGIKDASHVPSGWEARCNPLKSITLDPAEFEILVGETSAAPKVIFDPEYVVNRNLTWTSSNESVAKVDATGRVTGLAEGTSTITAISDDGGKTSTSIVTVIGVGPSDLPGAFSVSADKKVLFSQGNLYWNGADWRFESNQYDFPRTWDAGHVGHIAWINDAGKAVSGNWNRSWAGGCVSLFTNDPGDPESPNPDFRIYEAKGKYRTLTNDEWDYMINERKVNGDSGEGYSYQIIFDEKIGGISVFGIFIFPDGFTKQATWKQEYKTWEAVNAAGIVFLPAAGFRNGTEMYVNPIIQDQGYYWTSSKDERTNRPKHLYFDTVVNDRGVSFENASADDAHSVRLVTESEPAVGTIYISEGIVGMYVGKTSDGKKLIVATKNYGSAGATGKGTSYTREELKNLSIPAGWQLPTAQDMAVLAGLGFMNDSAKDGAYNSRYDFFVPYTQGVSGGLREGRIWVVGGSDNDFYWFRSDNKSGLTTTPTASPSYYVRLVKKL